MGTINNDLENIHWDLLAEEGISKKDLESVDLDIEFTPVIPTRGGSVHNVIKTIGDSYLLPDHPIFNTAISSEELKVMRYRYLNFNRKNKTTKNQNYAKI